MLRVVVGSYEHNLLCVALDIEHDTALPIFHFTPHTQSIRTLAWSKKTLASGANDEHIRLYDLTRRKELGTLMRHDGAVIFLEFYKSKWLFSAGEDGLICIWRSKDWEILAELDHKAPVADIAIHSSGKVMLSVGENRMVLWNLMTARRASVKKLHSHARQVAFVPNKQAEYVIAYAKTVDLYSQAGEVVRTWTLPSPIHKLIFYNELMFVSCDNGAIYVYKPDEEEIVRTLQGHAKRVKDMAVYEHYMASVSSDGNIVVWDLDTWSQISVYNAGDRLNCVALLPDSIESKRVVKPIIEHQSEPESEEEEEIKPKRTKPKRAKVIITED